MELQWKSFPKSLLLVLFKTLISLECFKTILSDVTYKDIQELNATCKGLDSCEIPRKHKVFEHCNCGVSCNLLGTCCADSKYRNNQVVPLKNYDCEYYQHKGQDLYLPMINSCDPDMLYDETTEKFCSGKAEKLKDPFLAIPVTDPVTGISYKNHYCFACNRNNGKEKPIPWDLRLKNEHVSFELKSIPDVRRGIDSWYIILEEGLKLDVSIVVRIPDQLKSNLPYCYNFDMTSECADDWTDEDIEKKCMSYMALTRILSNDGTFYSYYRNPHCAICNYEDMNDKICLVPVDKNYGERIGQYAILFVELSSLQEETLKCGKNMVYDYFKKNCRSIPRARFRYKFG